MRNIIILIFCSSLILSCKSDSKDQPQKETGIEAQKSEQVEDSTSATGPEIIPISHATAIVEWDDTTIYVDPVGGAAAFSTMDQPDLVLVTDIHGDHLDPETISALELGNSKIVVPQAVQQQLPDSLDNQMVVMNNGERIVQNGFSIEAIPMYNLREAAKNFHPKGRGNGYILEKNGKRLYIAGDTEDIPEMRNLQDIDIALIPMNLPYTMTVEKAADAVLEFEPKQVYPYHFRGQDGKSDVQKFKKLVEDGNKDIEVIIAEWYPEDIE